MTLKKEISVDKIEVDKLGCVSVRTATSVVEDGALIARSFHRHVIAPGDDYSQEDAQVKAVCAATHTTDAIAAYKAAAAAQGV